jgi:hypothetical protein
MSSAITLSCLCGAVTVATQTRPAFIHDCNCTLCTKSGARWGYFHPDEVAVAGQTRGYSRDDKDSPNAQIRFCPKCGATTHFVLTEGAVAKFGNTMMGVNMRLADPGDLAGIELRYPDGRSWPGEGDFTYVSEPRTL